MGFVDCADSEGKTTPEVSVFFFLDFFFFFCFLTTGTSSSSASSTVALRLVEGGAGV